MNKKNNYEEGLQNTLKMPNKIKNNEDESQNLEEADTKINEDIKKQEAENNLPPLNKNEENEEEKENSNNELMIQEIAELKDEKLRLLAEMENLRKRTDRERVDSIKYGSINLARDILSPGDNLSRALSAIPKEEEKSKTISNLIDGLMMVKKEFTSVLEKHGVKKIEALNEKFDHNLHQAILEVETIEVEEGNVVQEVQSGFTMYDKLLRPSMVGVSKKPFKNDKDQEK